MLTDQYCDIVLFLNKLEYIIIQLISPAQDLSLFDHVNVVAHTADHRKIILHTQRYWIWCFIEDFRDKLQEALNNTLDIDATLADQLSFHTIRLNFNFRHDVATIADEELSTLLMKHQAFQAYGADTPFLYRLGSTIFFKVSPCAATRKMDDYDYNDPDDSIKNNLDWETFYIRIQPILKPTVKFALPLEIARQWMKQLDELYVYARYNYTNTPRMLADRTLLPLGSVNRGCGDDEYPVRASNTLDICCYHDPIYGTDPAAHAEFLAQVHQIHADWMKASEEP